MEDNSRFAFLSLRGQPDHVVAGYSAEHFRTRCEELKRHFAALISRFGEPARVIDVGCGNGSLTDLLCSPLREVYAIDLSPRLVADGIARRSNINFLAGSATELPFADESFDAVTSFGLLQHIRDLRSVLSEAVRVLRPGGFGMIEFLPRFTARDLGARVPAYLLRGEFQAMRRLFRDHLFGQSWGGMRLKRYPPSVVCSTLRALGVRRTWVMSRRALLFNGHNGVVGFVR